MNNIKPGGLRCEFVENPIGVQREHPLLNWKCVSDRKGGSQSAYQIVAAHTLEQLECGDYTVWNTGKVESKRFFAIPYEGVSLISAERVYWKVRIWDENGEPSEFSEPAYFEMGLLRESDWTGRWMSFLGGLVGNGLQLRYSFDVKKQPVRARAYVGAVGYYEFHMNGNKIGDKLLDPGATDISKTVFYSAYDVTALLKTGLNVVGIVLGTGWAGQPKAILQLNIEYADGTIQRVVTDWGIGWYVSKGPILYNSIYDGEDYDARLEKDGWDTPEYQTTYLREMQRPNGWNLATIVEAPGGKLVGEISTPIRVTDSVKPNYLRTLPDGRRLYDIGINLSGWVAIEVAGERGAKVSLTFAEQLDSNGDLDMVYLRSARCQDNYTLRGDIGQESYRPRFTYHGFRYFTLKTSGNVTVNSLTAEFVRSDLKKNAQFTCDNDLLNRMAYVMWHTDACNMHSIPTDCCQRDERLGWTTDTTSRAEGCTYHFDVASFFDKWVRDIMDTQDGKGYFADTAPHRWGRRPCDPQVNTPISLPLLLHHVYGNRQVLSENYSRFQKYVEALLRESDHFLISRTGFGEWACPAGECYPEESGAGAVSKHVDPTLVSTAYLYKSVKEFVEISTILGKGREAAYYQNLADIIRKGFNERFFHPETGQYDTGSQSSNSLAIHLGLVPDEYLGHVVENIVQNVQAKDYHMTTGNMGTKALIETLSEFGEDDVVYRLMTQTTSPSFGYMLEQGATSIWERWEADRDNNIMNSHNHPMLAACCTWFYKYLGGVRLAAHTTGSQELLLHPCAPSQIHRVKTSMEIPAGCVKAEWEKTASEFRYEVEIPFNSRATVILEKRFAPKEASLIINGGNHEGILSVASTQTEYRVEFVSGQYQFLLR